MAFHMYEYNNVECTPNSHNEYEYEYGPLLLMRIEPPNEFSIRSYTFLLVSSRLSFPQSWRKYYH